MKLLILLFALYIALATASDNFLEGVKRAKYFIKTDDAVPLWEVTLPANEFTQMKSLITNNNMFGNNDFKTKNAQLVFTLGGETKTFPEVTFSLGGFSSRYYPRQAFNVKIRNDKLFGRKQFRIRSEAREATFLRSKLFCDINNRLGQPDSVSANYIKLTINGEDMGFYVIMDSVKLTYVNIEHDDKDSTNLIQCGDLNSDLTSRSMRSCTSENDDNPDMSSFQQLLNTLDRANTVAQMENEFDVETFMKAVILEWLTGSWDHFCLNGHNFNMYKPPNGKWEMILYDFDATFGQDLSIGLMLKSTPGIVANNIDTWTKAKFEDWQGNKHVINVILKDRPQIFKSCLQEIITKAFNPKILFPHIDYLKEFIQPYVQEDKSDLPGRLNPKSQCYDYTYSQWDANSEFTHIPTLFMGMQSQSYGLKRWILDKFNFVCSNYDIDCSVASEYLNNRYTYTTTTYSQPTNVAQNGGGNQGWPINGGGGWPINGGGWPNNGGGNQGWPNNGGGNQGWPINGGGNQGWPINGGGNQGWPNNGGGNQGWPNNGGGNQGWPINGGGNQGWPNNGGGWNIPATTTTTTRTTTTKTKTTNYPQPTSSDCWATRLGYSCCTTTKDVVYSDDDGDWGIENDQWCGIIKGSIKTPCWSIALGFQCCSSCIEVSYTDSDGKWGVENNDWCGIPTSC